MGEPHRSTPRDAWRAVVASACAIVLVTACGGAASPSPTERPSANPTATSPSPALPSPTASAAGTASSVPSSPVPSGPAASLAPGDPKAAAVDLEPVVGGLSSPVIQTGPADGTDRLVGGEQTGAIRVVHGGSLVDRPFLDLTGRVTSGGERGLLGLAFEPDFGRSGSNRFYVNYTDTNGNTVIAEYRVAGNDPDAADRASERVLLRVDQPFSNHNGGILAFGPDRMLYAGLGDGGSGGDPMGNGQRLDTHLGKILRLDPLGTAGPDLAPPDNPFVGQGDAKPEIWSYGLRNPWRLSFDRSTGDLWIGDVGQGNWEEIDVARAADGGGRGVDFGWNVMEGSHCYPSGDSCDRSGLALPIAEYAHDAGCAVVGGYVDRAPDAGALAGTYLFSDNCSGTVWGIPSAATEPQEPVVLAPGGRSISSFGEDADGRVYATDLGGGVLLRVVGRPR
jgi:glucose/arabinose dehydrogenase